MKSSKLIPVCSECLTATCWQGQFYCDKYRTANVVYKTRRELKKLNREHPSWWKTDAQLIPTSTNWATLHCTEHQPMVGVEPEPPPHA